jgi:sulfate transport system permease protein
VASLLALLALVTLGLKLIAENRMAKSIEAAQAQPADVPAAASLQN